jgi:hypothetical protein
MHGKRDPPAAKAGDHGLPEHQSPPHRGQAPRTRHRLSLALACLAWLAHGGAPLRTGVQVRPGSLLEGSAWSAKTSGWPFRCIWPAAAVTYITPRLWGLSLPVTSPLREGDQLDNTSAISYWVTHGCAYRITCALALVLRHDAARSRKQVRQCTAPSTAREGDQAGCPGERAPRGCRSNQSVGEWPCHSLSESSASHGKDS